MNGCMGFEYTRYGMGEGKRRKEKEGEKVRRFERLHVQCKYEGRMAWAVHALDVLHERAWSLGS